jgi:ABC-type glycerol-3-phosphate transport system substrate-binding protein
MILGVNPHAKIRRSRRSILRGTLLVGAVTIAGCRAPMPAGPPPTLTIYAQDHPVQAVQDLLASQAEAAGRDVGAKVDLQWTATDLQRARLGSQIAAKQLPDIGIVGGPDSAPLAARGVLRDVRESLDRIAGINGDLFPPFKDLATAGPFGDRPAHQPAPVWAIPHLSLGAAWLINSDALDKSGQDVPSSFDDCRELAKATTDPATQRFGWGGTLPSSDAADNFVQAALLAEGAALFDGAGYRVDLNPPDAVPGLGVLASLYRAENGSPLAPAGIVDWLAADVASGLAAGRLAQTIDFGGMYARIIGENPKQATRIRALPFPAGSKGWFTAATTSLITVFESVAKGNLAVRLVEALLQPRRFEQVVQAGCGSVVPPYAYLMRTPFWDQDPNYIAFAAGARGDPARQFQFATLGQPAPLTLPVAAVRGGRVLVSMARSVATGDQALLQAAQAMRERTQALVLEGYAVQPVATAVPTPGWLHLLEMVQRDLK